jgi:uncharacterized phage infection (PIP) family protein YhgE
MNENLNKCRELEEKIKELEGKIKKLEEFRTSVILIGRVLKVSLPVAASIVTIIVTIWGFDLYRGYSATKKIAKAAAESLNTVMRTADLAKTKADTAARKANDAVNKADSLRYQIKEMDVAKASQELHEAKQDYENITKKSNDTISKHEKIMQQLKQGVELEPVTPDSGFKGRIEFGGTTEKNGIEKRNFTLFFADTTYFRVKFKEKK